MWPFKKKEVESEFEGYYQLVETTKISFLGNSSVGYSIRWIYGEDKYSYNNMNYDDRIEAYVELSSKEQALDLLNHLMSKHNVESNITSTTNFKRGAINE